MDPKKEQQWADRIVDPDNDADAEEPTYRDGSVQHECWAGNGYTRNTREEEDD